MRQILSSMASVVVGACCLGLTPLVAALSALGAGFLINDAILIPLLVLFLALSVWSLNRSRRRHARKGPLLLGLLASVLAFAGLWLFVPLSYAGFAGLLAASVWDMVLVRRSAPACEI